LVGSASGAKIAPAQPASCRMADSSSVISRLRTSVNLYPTARHLSMSPNISREPAARDIVTGISPADRTVTASRQTMQPGRPACSTAEYQQLTRVPWRPLLSHRPGGRGPQGPGPAFPGRTRSLHGLAGRPGSKNASRWHASRLFFPEIFSNEKQGAFLDLSGR
jgi:hypothetical protein